ncbi:MAG: hypothetical protein JWO82_2209 [Akkermansiaceae bacterium]|nr:hypothetical protein [Akkermansiaceae bacterium]
MNLTLRPPRSPRLTLGGYAILPRLLDKGRALLAGTCGEYTYHGRGTNRHFFGFTGIDPDELKTELAAGKGDGEILEWVRTKTTRQEWEIAAWSQWVTGRTPDSDAETLGEFAESVGKFTTTREDIKTWFDLLDLDDHCSFGGKA